VEFVKAQKNSKSPIVIKPLVQVIPDGFRADL